MKCTGTTDEDELAYYITECAAILGVSSSSSSNNNNVNNNPSIPTGRNNNNNNNNNVLNTSKHAVARQLLTSIFTQITSWKMHSSNNDNTNETSGMEFHNSNEPASATSSMFTPE